jgi:hypothetical protein
LQNPLHRSAPPPPLSFRKKVDMAPWGYAVATQETPPP